MKTSSSNAWWREMGAISRGMMFVEDAIATPLAPEHAERGAQAATAPPSRVARTAKPGKRTFGLYEDFLFLGGRPMTAGHNDDIDEPFPQTRGAASQRFGGQRNQPSHTCATC